MNIKAIFILLYNHVIVEMTHTFVFHTLKQNAKAAKFLAGVHSTKNS